MEPQAEIHLNNKEILRTVAQSIPYRLGIIVAATFINLNGTKPTFYNIAVLLVALVCHKIVHGWLAKQWMRRCKDDPGYSIQSVLNGGETTLAHKANPPWYDWTPWTKWKEHRENGPIYSNASLAIEATLIALVVTHPKLPVFSSIATAILSCLRLAELIQTSKKAEQRIENEICENRIQLIRKVCSTLKATHFVLTKTYNWEQIKETPESTKRFCRDRALASLEHWGLKHLEKLPKELWLSLTIADSPIGKDFAQLYFQRLMHGNLDKIDPEAIQACSAYIQERSHTVDIPGSLMAKIL